jgi:hypothetical protein
MPHGKIIVVLVAVLFIAAVLRSLERSRTAIVDHLVVIVLSAFRLTTPIGPAFLPNLTIHNDPTICSPTIRSSPTIRPNLTIHTFPGRSTISCLLCLRRPPS